MRKLSILIGLFFLSLMGYAQNDISGKSGSIKLKIIPKFVDSLPPNLYLNLKFEDDNNNQILEFEETAKLTLTILNKGKGPAQGINVKVENETYNPFLLIENSDISIPSLLPSQSKEIVVEIFAERAVKTQVHKFKITISEHFGFDIDPSYLIFNTFELPKPQLVFSGLKIIDNGFGTTAIIEDGQLQAGEKIDFKISIQNIGQDISTNTFYEIRSEDPDIVLKNNIGIAGNLKSGEVEEVLIYINPNKNIFTREKLPIYLNVSNEEGFGEITHFQLPIYLDQSPSKIEIVEVNSYFEEFKKNIAQFEYDSEHITVTESDLLNVKQVSPSKTNRPNSIAIIFGIEEYKILKNTPYASNDAHLISEYFKDVLGVEKIYLYTNNEVSGFFFEDIFNPEYGELKKNVKEGETDIFIYYSGQIFPSEYGKRAYLLPSDGRVEAIESRGFDINDLYSSVQSLEAKSVTLIFDACYADLLKSTESYSKENSLDTKKISRNPIISQIWMRDATFSVFTSSKFNETSFRYDRTETGLFTYYFCAGLQGEADFNKDNKITNGELASYISKNVKKIASSIGSKQISHFNGNTEFVLSEY